MMCNAAWGSTYIFCTIDIFWYTFSFQRWFCLVRNIAWKSTFFLLHSKFVYLYSFPFSSYFYMMRNDARTPHTFSAVDICYIHHLSRDDFVWCVVLRKIPHSFYYSQNFFIYTHSHLWMILYDAQCCTKDRIIFSVVDIFIYIIFLEMILCGA